MLHQLSVFHIAFLFSLLPFLLRLPSGVKNQLATETDQFCTGQGKSRAVLGKNDLVCDFQIWARLETSHAVKITERCIITIQQHCCYYAIVQAG